MVGWEKPGEVSSTGRQNAEQASLFGTFLDFLATVDLGHLLFEEFVSLLADVDDLLSGEAEVFDSSQNLLRDLGSSLVFGQGIGVVKGVVCKLSQQLDNADAMEAARVQQLGALAAAVPRGRHKLLERVSWTLAIHEKAQVQRMNRSKGAEGHEHGRGDRAGWTTNQLPQWPSSQR